MLNRRVGGGWWGWGGADMAKEWGVGGGIAIHAVCWHCAELEMISWRGTLNSILRAIGRGVQGAHLNPLQIIDIVEKLTAEIFWKYCILVVHLLFYAHSIDANI